MRKVILIFVVLHFFATNNVFSKAGEPHESPIKTIKTKHGEVFDCVDIYKQPSLSHPLLKNHTVQMRPSIDAQKIIRESFAILNSTCENIAPITLDEKCPTGTVPIRRYSSANGSFVKPIFQFSDWNFSSTGFAAGLPHGVDFAGIVVSNPGEKYQGVGGRTTVYQPTVDPHQYSGAYVHIQTLASGSIGSAEAGWMVNPDLYGDNLAHLFISWNQQNNGKDAVCFDLRCPGFVVVNKNMPIGAAINPATTPGGAQIYAKLRITLDPSNGNLWVTYLSDSRSNAQDLGYWPKSLFQGLGSGGDLASWGGVVYSPVASSPSMGAGGVQFSDFPHSAHFAELVLNKDGTFQAPIKKEKPAVLNTRCYKVGEFGLSTEASMGYCFFYGGPKCNG